MRIIVYYVIYMQFSINLININNINVLSHYCCIFGLNAITLWTSGLYICFLGLHGSHANKLTSSSSSSAHTNGDCSDTQTKACLRT